MASQCSYGRGEKPISNNLDTERFLEHFGVKGMRWGKRQATAEVTLATTPKPKASTDAVKTSEFKERAKSGGAASLSTKELQELVLRQNLEQQYEKLNPAPVSAGKKLMGEVLPSVGKLGYAAYRAYYPAPVVPMSTDLRVTSGKQKAADMALHFGKEVLKEHGLAIGMQIVKSLV